ncbi:MAG TPA: hypothetical protein VF590_02500 [Isosphaeraceae bacterium]|jgi:hypothetical protein
MIVPKTASLGFPPVAAALAVLLTLVGPAGAPRAQESPKAGEPFPYHREVPIPPGAVPPRVVVTQFFTHGALQPRGENLVVSDGRRHLVPWRLLQVGPDDFCRVAFQVEPNLSLYKIA